MFTVKKSLLPVLVSKARKYPAARNPTKQKGRRDSERRERKEGARDTHCTPQTHNSYSGKPNTIPLMYAYIDESGVVTKGQGEYFITASFVAPDRYTAARCLKDIREKHLKKQYKRLSELKFNNCDTDLIKRILRCIVQHDITIYYIAWKKGTTNKTQLELKTDLFAKLISRILTDTNEPAEIIIDNFLKKTQQTRFTESLKTTTGTNPMQYADSQKCPGIQIADFIAGTIGRLYNHPEDPQSRELYTIIQDKIRTK